MSKVSIQRHRQGLIIQPAVSALRQLLRTEQHGLIPTDDGYAFGTLPQNLTSVTSSLHSMPAALGVPAGLKPAVLQWLAREGLMYEDHCPAPPLPSPADHTHLLDLGMLDLVREHDRGLVRHAPGVGVDHLVAQIALAWPQLRVGVAVTRIDDARRRRQQLADRLGEPVALTTGRHPIRVDPRSDLPEDRRILVGTYQALASHPAYARLDILVAADAVQATAKKPYERLIGAERARLYGLLSSDRPVSPAERDLMWCLFGFPQVTIPAHGIQHRPVEVFRVSIKGGPQVPVDADLFEVKLQGLWHHPVRNRHIVRLATLLAGDDRQALAARYPDLAAIDWLLTPTRVLVLVEGVDHALALAEQLPGWPVMTGPVTTTGLSRSQVRRLAEGERGFGGPRKAIVTTSAEDAHRLGSDVVIRVDGGLGLPPLPGLDLSGADQPRRLLLVDLADRHHPELRRRSRARLEAYAAAGWFLAGGAPRYRELELFESTRPKWQRPE